MESPISTKSAILQVLSKESACGADIMEAVLDETSGKLKLHSGSVYPALSALEDDGMIARRKIEGDSRASYYELTKKGREVAKHHRVVISQVFFGGEREKEKRVSRGS